MSKWTDSQLADFSRIEEISGGDREFETSLFALYVTETRRNILKIDKALQTGAMEELRAEAHTVKGASANTGLGALAEVALALELTAAAGDVSAATEANSNLLECFDATLGLLGAKGYL